MGFSLEVGNYYQNGIVEGHYAARGNAPNLLRNRTAIREQAEKQASFRNIPLEERPRYVDAWVESYEAFCRDYFFAEYQK